MTESGHNKVPETAAGKALVAWLEAFNSGEPEQLLQLSNTHKEAPPLESLRSFRVMTGGFNVLRIEGRGPGRPRTVDELRALVVSMAVENPSWGYTRLRDVLRTLGHEIGRTTIQEILKEQGIEPAPSRKKQMSWSEFLRAHWGAIAAWDFLTVEVLTLRGLVRYHVLIVIDLASRRVEIGGIVHEPTGAWMMQVVRNLLDAEDGFLVGKTKLIMDRDPVFTSDVRTLLRSGGVETVRLPARSPNLNAFAERFVLSIKSECLDRLILLGEGHLRMAVREYVAHYNLERPHQGLDGRLITPANENGAGQIECRERLGGLLRYYHREAA